jgi:hypothetical protein
MEKRRRDIRWINCEFKDTVTVLVMTRLVELTAPLVAAL